MPKLELEQMLLVVDEADKPEIQENISFYDANLSGLTQELQQLKREGLFTVSVCDKDCDIASKRGIIDFYGTIHIELQQTSKEKISNANAIAHCE